MVCLLGSCEPGLLLLLLKVAGICGVGLGSITGKEALQVDKTPRRLHQRRRRIAVAVASARPVVSTRQTLRQRLRLAQLRLPAALLCLSEGRLFAVLLLVVGAGGRAVRIGQGLREFSRNAAHMALLGGSRWVLWW